jgi:hypothetical protein
MPRYKLSAAERATEKARSCSSWLISINRVAAIPISSQPQDIVNRETGRFCYGVYVDAIGYKVLGNFYPAFHRYATPACFSR